MNILSLFVTCLIWATVAAVTPAAAQEAASPATADETETSAVSDEKADELGSEPTCKEIYEQVLANRRSPSAIRGFRTLYQPGLGRGEILFDQSATTDKLNFFRVCAERPEGNGGGRLEPLVTIADRPPQRDDPMVLNVDFKNKVFGESADEIGFFPWRRYNIVVAGWPERVAGESGRMGDPEAVFFAETVIVDPAIGAIFGGLVFAVGLAFVAATLADYKGLGRVIQGPKERASLTNCQILWFTVVVVTLVVQGLADTGTLAKLSDDILWLMGIAAGSAILAKVTDRQKARLSYDNYSWLQGEKFFQDAKAAQAARGDEAKPCLLCNDEGVVDVYRVQAAIFSVLVGVSLLLEGADALGDYQISQEILILLGLSQATYIGGKLVQPPTFAEVDKMITDWRTGQATKENARQTMEKAALDLFLLSPNAPQSQPQPQPVGAAAQTS